MTDDAKLFWKHWCLEERTWISAAKGCLCNWCEKKEDDNELL